MKLGSELKRNEIEKREKLGSVLKVNERENKERQKRWAGPAILKRKALRSLVLLKSKP